MSCLFFLAALAVWTRTARLSVAGAEDTVSSKVIVESLSDFQGEYVEPVELAIDQERWDDAIAHVRRALANPDVLGYLYPADGCEGAGLYVPLEQYLLELILEKAPPETAQKFRAEIDRAVRPALEEARRGDGRRLARLARRLDSSDLATQAHEALGDLSWERGDVRGACASWASMEVPEGATAGTPRAVLAQGILGAQSPESSAMAVSVAGVSVPASRWPVLLAGAAEGDDQAGVDWLCFGGSSSGVLLSPVIPDGAYLRFTGCGNLKLSASGSRGLRAGRYGGEDVPTAIPSHAAVMGERAYFSEDGVNYSAYDIETGKLKWRSDNIPTIVGQGYQDGGGCIQTPPFSANLVTREAIYVFAPKTEGRGDTFVPTFPRAYDPITDKLAREFFCAKGQDLLVFAGPPLVWRQNLLCVGCNAKGSLYAVAFDRASGQEVWRTFLCFQSVGGRRFGFRESNLNPAFLAVDRETLFVSTNRGAVVSIDLVTGRRNWATTYPMSGAQYPHTTSGAASGWEPNPVLVRDGQVVVAPMDANHLRGYDTATGELLWEWKPSPSEKGTERMLHLLGPADGKLVLVGTHRGCVVEWQGGKRVGEFLLSPGGSAGRPALSSKYLYVAGRESAGKGGGIFRIELATLKLQGCFLAWPEGFALEGANLTLTESALIAVSRTSFLIYSISQNPEQMFRQVIQESPTQAKSYRSLARYLAEQGRYREALEALREGISRCPEEPGISWTGEGIDLCVRFLRPEGARGKMCPPSEAVPFLEKAAAAIPNLAAHPSFLLNLAVCREAEGRLDEAFEIYGILFEGGGASASLGEIEVGLPGYAAWQMARLAGRVSAGKREGWSRKVNKSTSPSRAAHDPAQVSVSPLAPLAVAWKEKLGSQQISWLVPSCADGSVARDLILAQAHGGALYEAATGKRLCEPEVLAPFQPVKDAHCAGGLLFILGGAKVCAFDPAACQMVWSSADLGELPASASGRTSGVVSQKGMQKTSNILSVAAGAVAVLSDRGVTVLDMATGEMLWALPGISAEAVSVDPRGYVTLMASGTLQVRDLGSGALLDDPLALPKGQTLLFFTGACGNIALLGRQGDLQDQEWFKLIDPATRKEILSSAQDPDALFRSAFAAATSGNVLVVLSSESCQQIDMETGKRKVIPLQATLQENISTLVAVRTDGRFLFLRAGSRVSGEGEVVCLSLETGEKRWSVPALPTMPSHLVDMGSWVLYDSAPHGEVRTSKPTLVVLDKETGKRVEQIENLSEIPGHVMLLAGGLEAVVATLRSGEVVGLGPVPGQMAGRPGETIVTK